jgi:superfamily II DNA or RNA helicase
MAECTCNAGRKPVEAFPYLLMTLSHRLDPEFDAASQRKGRSLFLSRAVRLNEGSPRHFHGEVQGTRYYEVKVDFDGRVVTLSCECPFFAGSGPCKHLWATVLEAEKRGLLTEVLNAPVIAMDEGLEEDDSAFELNEPQFLSRRAPATITTRVPLWQDHLTSIQRSLLSEPAVPKGMEILYVIDAQGSRAIGGLDVGLYSRNRKKTGEWSAIKELRLSPAKVTGVGEPVDEEALAAIFGGQERYGFQFGPAQQRKVLPPALAKHVIPLIAPTGRLGITQGGLAANTELIEWDGGAPWSFRVEVRSTDKNQWKLIGMLCRGEERMPLTEPELVTEGGFVFARGKVARLDDSGAFPWIAQLRLLERILIPDNDRESAIARLLEMPVLPPLDLDEAIRFEERVGTPKAALRLMQHGAEFQANLLMDYGRGWVGQMPGQRGFYYPDERLHVLRDQAFEEAAKDKLRELGLRAPADVRGTWRLGPKTMPRVVRELLKLGWHLDAEGKVFRGAGARRMEVRSGIDWFELHAAVDYDGQSVGLPELIAALRRGDGMVQLGDGTMGMLPEEWLEKFAPLVGLGEMEADHLRFRQNQAGLLDALLAAQPETRVDELFSRVRERVRGFSGVRTATQPEGFRGELREYQREGLGWMDFLREFGFGGCLADDMGVGKTAQVLAVLETRRAAGIGPSLVVAPRSLMFNWEQEAARFTPQLRVLQHSGITRSTALFSEYDLILTTYGTLVRDAPALSEIEFDYVVLDEAQAVKNAATASAKAVRLLQGRHRLALSGTPVENHLGELWSLFEFLNPGMLGEAKTLRLAGGLAQNPGEDSRLLLAHALRPFILRRTKKQVAKELPEKTEQTILCEFDAAQRKQYEDLRKFYREKLLNRVDQQGLNKSKMHVLEALLRLRQAACHPGLLDPKKLKEPSPKLDTLLAQLSELREEGHKALVFSQFTSLLAIVRDRLDEAGTKYEYLDGSTTDRGAHVAKFQNDAECGLFLISLKAGGLGLNLTAADYVFLLDPWWNPAVEAQAIDRAHRIGQAKPVFAYRLITKGTVEERVLELQKTKRDLADAILGEDNSLIRDLQREDLELLLS